MQNKFIKLYTAKEVADLAEELPKTGIILLDVDDTLITPKASLFRIAPGELSAVDLIKQNPQTYPNFKDIVSKWRAARKTMLVDSQWPAIIKEMKKTHPVYALTKMDIGQFGVIESMEKWRHDELKSFGFEFSPLNISENKIASCYDGIIMTGSYSKQETLKQYIHLLNSPTHIIFVDDKLQYLEEVASFCDEHNIEYIGVHFCGVEKFKPHINPEIAIFQKKLLLNNEKWLEDEEVEKLIDF